MARLCTPVSSRWKGAIITPLRLLFFPFGFVYLQPNLTDGSSTGGVEKGRRPFHPRALIVLLVAFLVARVSSIDARVLFSHTAGGGGGGGNGRR